MGYFILGFIVGFIFTCWGTVKMLRDSAGNATLIAGKFRITIVDENK